MMHFLTLFSIITGSVCVAIAKYPNKCIALTIVCFRGCQDFMTTRYENSSQTLIEFAETLSIMRHPMLNPLLYVFAYNVIYLYSWLQLKYYKCSTMALSHIRIIYDALHKNKNIVELRALHFYQNNIVIIEYLLNQNAPLDTISINIHPVFVFDYVVFIDTPSSQLTPKNMVCYNFIPVTLLYEVSNIIFLSIKLEYNNKIYNIVLKTDMYNYYIVNNRINAQFITYYLINVVKEHSIIENIKYTLEILDNDINIHSLTEMHTIIIKKDTYEIEIIEELPVTQLKV